MRVAHIAPRIARASHAPVVPAAKVRLSTAHRPPGMSDREVADRILASLLHSRGPIVLAVPGTSGGAYEHVVAGTVRAFLALHHGAAAIASIPYDTRIARAVARGVGLDRHNGSDMLEYLLRQLHALAPDRPVSIVSESQGSWIVGDVLQDPELASMVRRVVMFSKPGFAPAPTSGEQLDAGGMHTAPEVLRIEHTDDIVPGIYLHLNGARVGSILNSLLRMLGSGAYHYPPHDYMADSEAAARFLVTGAAPTKPMHSSREHRG